jgi:hypothetical protein
MNAFRASEHLEALIAFCFSRPRNRRGKLYQKTIQCLRPQIVCRDADAAGQNAPTLPFLR